MQKQCNRNKQGVGTVINLHNQTKRENHLKVRVMLELVAGHDHGIDAWLQVGHVGGELFFEKHRFDAQPVIGNRH